MITSAIVVIIVIAIGIAFYRSVTSDEDFFDNIVDFLWDASIFICVGLFVLWSFDELIKFIMK